MHSGCMDTGKFTFRYAVVIYVFAYYIRIEGDCQDSSKYLPCGRRLPQTTVQMSLRTTGRRRRSAALRLHACYNP
jgi:hypothetical protein